MSRSNALNVSRKACVFLGLLALASAALGGTHVWTGASSSDWFDPGNWSGGVPTTGGDVTVGSAGLDPLLTNTTAYLASFTIANKSMSFGVWSTTLRATQVTLQSGAILTLPGPFTTSDESNRVHVVCSNLTVETGAKVDVDGLGFYPWNGPGTASTLGTWASGTGYGGKGGGGLEGMQYGVTYGSAGAPLAPGSGGGSHSGYQSSAGSAGGTYPSPYYFPVGGSGGGAVRVHASGTVNLRGTISANGSDSFAANYGGGGSGGAVYLTCGVLASHPAAALRANGGDATVNAGAGGGGRIAVWQAASDTVRAKFLAGQPVHSLIVTNDFSGYFAGAVTVANGTGYVSASPPQPGTAFFHLMMAPEGSLFIVR